MGSGVTHIHGLFLPLSLVRVLSIAGKITTSRPGEATPKQRNLAKKQARKTPRLQEEERDEADRPRQATHSLVRANAFAAAQLLRIGDLARQERNADLQWKERKGLRSRCLHGPRAEGAERLSACLLALAAPPAPRQVRLRVRVGRPVRRPSGVQAERSCTASARTSGPAARQRPGCRIERGSCLKQGSRWAGERG